jgi:hypothetical protein
MGSTSMPSRFANDAPLQRQREHAVGGRGQKPNGHFGPRIQRPGVGKGGLRLLVSSGGKGFVDNVLGNVIEQIDHRIDAVMGSPAFLDRELAGGAGLIDVREPAPRRFTRPEGSSR